MKHLYRITKETQDTPVYASSGIEGISNQLNNFLYSKGASSTIGNLKEKISDLTQ